ncbi:MAG: cell division protein FtsQ/DivIB, partial [Pseudomonadota bacterium]
VARASRELTLPRIVGRGGALAAAEIVDAVAASPELASAVRAFHWIDDRRWSLELENGVRIKLATDAWRGRLAWIARAQADGRLTAGAVVDLRVPGRAIFEGRTTARPAAGSHPGVTSAGG